MNMIRTSHAIILAVLLTMPALAGCASAAGLAVGTVAKAGTTATGVAVSAGSTATGLTAKTVIGGAKLGARGANAVFTNDPDISRRTLAHRAGREIGADRRDIRISDIYEDANRTDYIATEKRGEAWNCAVVEVEGNVSDAACEPVRR